MAAADAKDPSHSHTLRERDRWLEADGILVTTDYVIDETLTLIRTRISLDAAEKWHTMIDKSPRCDVEWITPDRVQKALHWFFKWRDQMFSFTDCTSFVVMAELYMDHVLTTDRHFFAAGFNVLPA